MPGRASTAEREVRDFIARWNTAYTSLDAAGLASLETADYEMVDRFGHWIKSEGPESNQRLWAMTFKEIYHGRPGPPHVIARAQSSGWRHVGRRHVRRLAQLLDRPHRLTLVDRCDHHAVHHRGHGRGRTGHRLRVRDGHAPNHLRPSHRADVDLDPLRDHHRRRGVLLAAFFTAMARMPGDGALMNGSAKTPAVSPTTSAKWRHSSSIARASRYFTSPIAFGRPPRADTWVRVEVASSTFA